MFRSAILLLCMASCAFAQSTLTAPVGKFPALNVQVTVGTQERAEPGSFYRKTAAIIPKVAIDGPGRMTPIPALEAVMLIITMDTKKKFKEREDVLKVYSADTLPIPEVQTGDRRQFSFPESNVTFDGYRDSSNVGGQMYKYYIFGLRDPASKEIIDFKTNDVALLTLCKAHPEKRDDFLNLSKNAKLPAMK